MTKYKNQPKMLKEVIIENKENQVVDCIILNKLR